MQFFGFFLFIAAMFCANGNPTVLSTTLAKALKATLAVGGRAAWKALTQKDGIFDGLSEQIKEQPEMLAPFFPLTFGIAGGEILVEQEKFNMDYIFNLFERMTGRDQLNKICFVEAEEVIIIEKAEKNLPIFLTYTAMNGKKMDVYLCD